MRTTAASKVGMLAIAAAALAVAGVLWAFWRDRRGEDAPAVQVRTSTRHQEPSRVPATAAGVELQQGIDCRRENVADAAAYVRVSGWRPISITDVLDRELVPATVLPVLPTDAEQRLSRAWLRYHGWWVRHAISYLRKVRSFTPSDYVLASEAVTEQAEAKCETRRLRATAWLDVLEPRDREIVARLGEPSCIPTRTESVEAYVEQLKESGQIDGYGLLIHGQDIHPHMPNEHFLAQVDYVSDTGVVFRQRWWRAWVEPGVDGVPLVLSFVPVPDSTHLQYNEFLSPGRQ